MNTRQGATLRKNKAIETSGALWVPYLSPRAVGQALAAFTCHQETVPVPQPKFPVCDPAAVRADMGRARATDGFKPDSDERHGQHILPSTLTALKGSIIPSRAVSTSSSLGWSFSLAYRETGNNDSSEFQRLIQKGDSVSIFLPCGLAQGTSAY